MLLVFETFASIILCVFLQAMDIDNEERIKNLFSEKHRLENKVVSFFTYFYFLLLLVLLTVPVE